MGKHDLKDFSAVPLPNGCDHCCQDWRWRETACFLNVHKEHERQRQVPFNVGV
jgi:hypothetical protein